MKRKFILAGSVAGALIAAGAAYGIVAHATADPQTIAACVAADGGIRLAPATGDCKKNETALTWNTVGPAYLVYIVLNRRSHAVSMLRIHES